MKENKKNIFTSNGTLTLLSIISLMVLFAAVCSLVIFFIHRAGLIELPFIRNKEEVTSPHEVQTTVGENIVPEYGAFDHEKSLSKLLSSFPYHEKFYAEFYITYIYDTYDYDDYEVEFYRIYKSGAKYRIEVFDMNDKLIKKIVCDGNAVAVSDYRSSSYTEYPVSDEFTFADQANLPSFLLLESGNYIIKNAYEDGEVFVVQCEYPKLGTSDTIRIDMSTGIMRSSLTYIDGAVAMFYDIAVFDTEYTFNDSWFFT